MALMNIYDIESYTDCCLLLTSDRLMSYLRQFSILSSLNQEKEKVHDSVENEGFE